MLARIAASLVLAWFVGYERYFNARATGAQVYCLVCMASCAVTLIGGHPELWYGLGSAAEPDPRPVISNILTGIGFLGAGIIVQSGTTVRGLTTAASLWASSVIGMLVGVGFDYVAVGVTLLFVCSMVAIPAIERRLPARVALTVTLRYREGSHPDPESINRYLDERHLRLAQDSISIGFDSGRFVMHFAVLASTAAYSQVLRHVSVDLPLLPQVESFDVARSSRG